MLTHRNKLKAFTLIEVLVAMAVISISLMAAIKVVSEVTVSASYMQEKTIAQWVAMNKVAELRLQKNWPSIGRANGDVEMAGQSWYWETEVKSTPDKSIRRLEVKVLPESDKDAETPVIFLTAFLGRPL